VLVPAGDDELLLLWLLGEVKNIFIDFNSVAARNSAIQGRFTIKLRAELPNARTAVATPSLTS
jgi:hypothetical protein